MRRILQGIITKISSSKTLSVRIDRVVVHPKYKKRFKVSKKFLVHDPFGTFKVGDVVSIKETRPISRLKRWVVLQQK
jgi:small subunit ribosomal protein S17